MAFCPNCGKPFEGTPVFCPSCGKPLQPTTPLANAFCPHCGATVDPAAEICPKCGVRIKQSPAATDQKNPWIAAVLSFLFTGLGQIYNGQIGKGIGFIILGVVFALTVIFLIGFILYPLFWIYNIYDAYKTAKKINSGAIKPD